MATKIFFGIMLLMLILGNVQVQAEECRAELTKEDRYQDLNNILKCFERNIQRLEGKIDRLEVENNSANKTIEDLKGNINRLEQANKKLGTRQFSAPESSPGKFDRNKRGGPDTFQGNAAGRDMSIQGDTAGRDMTIQGDKVGGDKIMGDKVGRDKIINEQ